MSADGAEDLALLSLGSNIDPYRHMGQAVARIAERFPGAEVSPLYLTAAVGFDGADFLNAAMAIRPEIGVEELGDWLKALEDGLGRRRDTPRFSDRPIDVDLVAFGDLVRQVRPVLPRPDLVNEPFTLRPCADIAPGYRHPVLERTLKALLADDAVAAGMRPVATGCWWEAQRREVGG